MTAKRDELEPIEPHEAFELFLDHKENARFRRTSISQVVRNSRSSTGHAVSDLIRTSPIEVEHPADLKRGIARCFRGVTVSRQFHHYEYIDDVVVDPQTDGTPFQR